MPESGERLLEPLRRLPVSGAREGPGSRLMEVCDGPLPSLAAKRVMREAVEVLAEPVGVHALDGVDDPRVEASASVEKEAAVGDLVGEGMLKVYSRSGESRAS